MSDLTVGTDTRCSYCRAEVGQVCVTDLGLAATRPHRSRVTVKGRARSIVAAGEDAGVTSWEFVVDDGFGVPVRAGGTSPGAAREYVMGALRGEARVEGTGRDVVGRVVWSWAGGPERG